MARTRSPNYPCISLPEALTKTKEIYAREHRNTMSRVVVAGHLGYGGVNGASASLISALLKYGLLEGRGDALRVSRDAVDALADRDDAAGRAALRRAALRPEIFALLASRFGEPPPSEANLCAHLERQGFTAVAARKAARAYLDTMRLLTPREAPQELLREVPVVAAGGGGGPDSPSGAQAEYRAPAPHSPVTPVTLRLPLPDDNWIEVQVGRKLSPAAYRRLQPLLAEVLERCLTEPVFEGAE